MNNQYVKVVEMQSVSPGAAQRMVANGIRKATELHVRKGMIVVYGREQFLLASASLGPVTRNNFLVANAKARTVLNSTRNTEKQRLYMETDNIDPNDYAGGIETKFGGGLALFVDDEFEVWVGAIAFSGGSEIEDVEICKDAAHSAGLLTTLS